MLNQKGLKKVIFAFGIILGLTSCLCEDAKAQQNKSKIRIIDGVKIQFHKHNSRSQRLKEGDIITFDLVIKNGADSVLQDTRRDGQPGKGMVQTPNNTPGAFKGTFEHGLRLLSLGDLATIFVPINALKKSVQAPLPPFLKPGTDLKYTVKIIKVQSKYDFEKEMEAQAAAAKKDAAKKLAQEPAMIADFIAKTGKKYEKTASGLNYFIEKPGSGPSPKNGETWVVNYRGTFLDGKEFDKGDKAEMPLGQMIPGFNEALTLMKAGCKARFIIPSAIAYGEQVQPGGPIPPNAVLVFELEVISKK
jgi:FKBP-type peptidyl-prolyl cis-trans isomerase FkpA